MESKDNTNTEPESVPELELTEVTKQIPAGYRYYTTSNQPREKTEQGHGWKIIRSIRNHRVVRALFLVVLVLLLGAIGFYLIAVIYSPKPFPYGILDALYLSVITITTVGYGDNLELLSLPQPGRTIGAVFSIVYLVVAYAAVVWASSTVVAYLVEGSLSGVLNRRRILRKINMLKDHYILCGVGRTGTSIADEFRKTGHAFAIIDFDKDTVSALKINFPYDELLIIEGDATEEDILHQAGIRRAKGIICNLANDRDNLFLTLTARAMNPALRIVSRGIEAKSKEKILRAGADSVVYPETIGALRMASEMIRPTVVSFLDKMLRDTRQNRVSEVRLSEQSKYAGEKIRDSGIYEDTGMLVLAISSPHKGPEEFIYNPSGDKILEPGSILVVIGDRDQIRTLEKFANPNKNRIQKKH